MAKAKVILLNAALLAGLLGFVLLVYWIFVVVLSVSSVWITFVVAMLIAAIVKYIIWFVRKVKRTRAAGMRDLDV